MKSLFRSLSKGTAIGCIIGIVLSMPFAPYIGIVLGGNLAGSWGWQLAKSPGVIFGITGAVILVAGGIILIGAFLGGVFGFLIERLMR
jgi:hypothetical protein